VSVRWNGFLSELSFQRFDALTHELRASFAARLTSIALATRAAVLERTQEKQGLQE
jgi:hypothetical protein